ncbi:MAG TPA: hypothetical protein VM120_09730 [Bryobacteraceae bacterium]|nr:hypothetical protein [Bryobacteraceae bacterium]
MKKLLANRANGAKSRGPKTPEGLQKSSRNAVKHGMCTKRLLEHESPEEFAALRQDYLVSLKPRNGMELDLFEDIVIIRWCQRRLWLIETTMMDNKIAEHRDVLDEEGELELDDATRLSHAYQALSDSMAQLGRHQSRLAREFRAAMKTLLDMQKLRQKEDFQNEPKSPSQPRPAAAVERPAAVPPIAGNDPEAPFPLLTT